jgi:hypothetical protein
VPNFKHAYFKQRRESNTGQGRKANSAAGKNMRHQKTTKKMKNIVSKCKN